VRPVGGNGRPGQGSNQGEAVMNILQRYVMGEVLRAFLMSLLTMTAIFVLFMVAAEAIRSRLLGPQDIAQLVPYVIPSTLPYTIPVSLLFAVTVIYGRIAGDNEVIAVKSAGLSVMTVIWPTILLAIGLSVTLLYVSRNWIPESAHNAKMVLFKDVEDTFYKFLKRDREFNNPSWPVLIKVSDVDGKVMKNATFKMRSRGEDNRETYSAIIQAKRAELHFDFTNKMAYVYLDQSELQKKDEDVMLMNDNVLSIPLPDRKLEMQKAVQEFTNVEIEKELVVAREKLATDRTRQAITAGFKFATGRLDQLQWGEVQRAFIEHSYWERRVNEFETEKQLRTSMAFGSLLFVILGAPVGILFAKRDFLSAFISCFVPIITLYYPLMLFGKNLGTEGTLDPIIALWIGNATLVVLAGWIYPRIIKH
jgi:lipopolysaccharide export system permease protein